jgi:hypothetical protein
VERMYKELAIRPEIDVAVANETVWAEIADGSWRNTGRTIWDFGGVVEYAYSAEDLCGSAKICNSSMLVRVSSDCPYITPSGIPVGVPEHFRERLFGRRIALVGLPLVNYAETISTARSKEGPTWGTFQCLLTGSMFIALEEGKRRKKLAKVLWCGCNSSTSPRAVSLVMTGIAIAEARSLLALAPIGSLVRFGAWALRHPPFIISVVRARKKYEAELEFLSAAPLTRETAALV